METEKFYAKGANMNITHPLPVLDDYHYPIENGVVNIYHYPDDTVLIQIVQDGKQPSLWVNRKFTVDETTNTVTIIPKNS